MRRPTPEGCWFASEIGEIGHHSRNGCCAGCIGGGGVSYHQPSRAHGRETRCPDPACRGAQHITMFQTVASMNAEAVDSFRQRLSTGPTDVSSARYDALFPRFGDGTRQSIDALFDGVEMEDGQQLLGVGAFIGDADAMSAEQEFWFTSGFEAVRRIGPRYVTPGSCYTISRRIGAWSCTPRSARTSSAFIGTPHRRISTCALTRTRSCLAQTPIHSASFSVRACHSSSRQRAASARPWPVGHPSGRAM